MLKVTKSTYQYDKSSLNNTSYLVRVMPNKLSVNRTQLQFYRVLGAGLCFGRKQQCSVLITTEVRAGKDLTPEPLTVFQYKSENKNEHIQAS